MWTNMDFYSVYLASPSLLFGVIYYCMNAFEQRLSLCRHLGGFR